jgi:predicted chitinase
VIDIEKFLFMYQGSNGTLNDHQRAGLADLMNAINNDENVTDIRWIAYMLATTKHETAKTWLPIAEYGKGSGRKYGTPDPATGHTYYGRGYVQLTWAGNYRSMGIALGIDLYNNPDLAMKPDVAYQIMSRGMRKGSFTGVGLSHYINGDKCDYRFARKIINGLDCSDRIAEYAQDIEAILKQCQA